MQMAKILKQYFKICLAFGRSSGELVFCPLCLFLPRTAAYIQPPTDPPPSSFAPPKQRPWPRPPLRLTANFICLHVDFHVVFFSPSCPPNNPFSF